MGLDKQTVCSGCNSSFRNSADQLWITTGNAAGLVRLLEGVGAIHDHRYTMFPHDRNIAVVHHQVLVTEGSAALGQPYLVITSLFYLFNGKFHSLATYELAFFHVHE